MKVRTRFAPSPTGLMHIGSVRTALYAYLTAKKTAGEFWLRIEDTDRKRLVQGSVEDIVSTLKWLGLNYDKLVTQSDRKDTYQKYAKQLVDEGKAYEKDGAIWFKMDLGGKTVVKDLVAERVFSFENKSQKDFVVLKSDGYPTYHLAHVVDDHLDEMSPVIRAPEWISSLPKHVQLFEAFKWQIPQYAHLTMILGSDRSKLSKRHRAKGASEYIKEGFLPEAILNYMALLGWTPKSGKEILSLDEMISEFELKETHLSNAIFDTVKLEWMNGEYIRQLSDAELTKRLQEFLIGHPSIGLEIGSVVPLIKERIKKLSDFIPLTYFIFEEPEYDIEIFKKIKIEEQGVVLKTVVRKLESMEKPWKAVSFEETFRNLAKELNIPVREMFQLIRVAVSGQLVTPPLFETVELIGDEHVLQRIKAVITKYFSGSNLPEESSS